MLNENQRLIVAYATTSIIPPSVIGNVVHNGSRTRLRIIGIVVSVNAATTIAIT